MSEDFYELLGVPRNASESEIRKAYREKVADYHPDVSEHPDAEERFKELQRAKEVLTDDSKRKEYDRSHNIRSGSGDSDNHADDHRAQSGSTTEEIQRVEQESGLTEQSGERDTLTWRNRLESTKSYPIIGMVVSVIVAVVVAFVGIIAGTALVVGSTIGIRSAGVSVTPFVFIVASLVLLQGVAFGGVALGYLRYRGLPMSYLGVRVPSLQEAGAVVVGYVVAIGVAISGAIAVSLTGVEAGSNQAAELGAENPEVLLLLIPASILIIGPGEELLFRGVVQNRLRESFSAVPGIALASAIFAAIHFVALSGGTGARLVSIVILFFPSLVFGAVYEFTDNLVVPALVHGCYNATLFTLLYVAIRFGEMQPPM